MKEAMFYERLKKNVTKCTLCHFQCVVADGSRGFCAVRENRGGTFYTLVYDRICAANPDPIEKKPLFHFMPGSRTFSIATSGCNFRCLNCQNHTISQLQRNASPQGEKLAPQEIVTRASLSGCASISYTYTEPTVFFELAYETALLAKEAGISNVFVTNGYITEQALSSIAPFLDAANIDLKSFSPNFYRDVAQADFIKVIDSILEYRSHGIWIELTTLIIPGLNDSDAELREMAKFIRVNLGADTPWHLSRFHPAYRMNSTHPTTEESLQRAYAIGKAEGLLHLYIGNVPGKGGESTFCPVCAALLIRRHGFRVESNRLHHGKCPECENRVAGVWPS